LIELWLRLPKEVGAHPKLATHLSKEKISQQNQRKQLTYRNTELNAETWPLQFGGFGFRKGFPLIFGV